MCICKISSGQSDSLLKDMSLEDLLNVKVTTASRTLQEQNLAPAKVTVITKDQIKMRNYQSLLDLINDLPGFKIDDKIYSGQRNSVTIRGIQGQQNFFILLDGIKISSPTNEALPIMENYPLHLAEQVEIVYGPASALYGADAVSGVINIITKGLPSTNKIVVDASATGGMYGYINSTLYIAKKFSDRSGFVLSGQYSQDQQPDLSKLYSNDTLLSVAHYSTGTFNTIFGPMTPKTPFSSKYEAPTKAYNVYGAYKIDNATISFFTNYTKIPNSWSNNTHNAVYDKDVYMAQSVSGVAASLKRTFNKVTSGSMLTGTYYNLRPESNYRNLYTGMEPAYKYAMSLSVKAEQQFDYAPSDKLNMTLGFNHERFNTIPQSADLIAPVNTQTNIEGTYMGTTSYYRPGGIPAQFYHVIYQNTGAFLQAQYSPSKKINFTLGARYDYNSRYKETFNPRFGVVYNASSRTTFKALYGSAFMAPPPSTAYVTYGSFETQDSGKTYSSTFLHLPNPGLRPLRSQNFEVSVRQYLTDNLVLTVDGYYTLLRSLFAFADDNATTQLYNNMFQGIPVGYVEVFVNEGRQRNYGGTFQLNLQHSFGSILLNTYASASYTEGRRYGATNGAVGNYETEIAFISPFMARIGTDVRMGKFTISPRATIIGRQNLPGIKDTIGSLVRLQTIPGYVLLNVALRYNIGKKLSAFANVSNALDQRYRAVSYNMDLNKTTTDLLHGQPQDPLRVTLGLNLSLN